MAIDWSKVQTAIDLAGRAGSIQTAMDRYEESGVVRVTDGNRDLDLPYTAAIKNLYGNRRDDLYQQSRDALVAARP